MEYAEKVAIATGCHTLKLSLRTGSQPDVLIALGWAGRTDPLGAALLRAHAGVVSGEVLAIVGGEAQTYAAKIRKLYARKQNLPKGDAWWESFAAAAVSYAIEPACRRCHGARYRRTPGAPALSTHVCGACRGTGLRAFPKVGTTHLTKEPLAGHFKDTLQRLTARRRGIERRMKKYSRTS